MQDPTSALHSLVFFTISVTLSVVFKRALLSALKSSHQSLRSFHK